jgi:hypothetical protein
MTPMMRHRSSIRDEQGMALIGVILLLILASGVCAALAVSGKTETTIAYNTDTSAQARAAAQAGLTTAVEVLLDTLNAGGLDPVPAVNAILVGADGVAGTGDDGSLWRDNELAPPGVKQQLGTLNGVSFEVQAFDDDDEGNRGLAVGALDLTEINEDGSTTNSQNSRIVIRAVGYGRNNTKVTLEAILSTTTLPAIVADGDIEIGGNVDISGANGGVHANGDVTVQGNSFSIAQDLTATGTIEAGADDNVGGDTLEGQSTMDVPSLLAKWADLEDHVDYYLGTDGLIRNPDGSAAMGCGSAAACEAAFGWHWEGGGNWSLNTTPPAGTFYSYGSITITGSPGPVTMSLLAEGDIDIAGSPELQPNSEPGFDTLFATQGDLEISGNLETPIIEGVVRILGQLKITGNPTIAGQVLIENEAVGTLATANSIAGHTTITYNGVAGNDTFDLAGWREIQ